MSDFPSNAVSSREPFIALSQVGIASDGRQVMEDRSFMWIAVKPSAFLAAAAWASRWRCAC
jgi:hypothetical protein